MREKMEKSVQEEGTEEGILARDNIAS